MEKKTELVPAAPVGKVCAWWIGHSTTIKKSGLIWYNEMEFYIIKYY